MSIKILHTADNHLTDIQYGSRARGSVSELAMNKVVDLAAERGIQHILCGGDLVDSMQPKTSVVQMLTRLEERLRNKGIVMYTITGNHDLVSPTWPEAVFVGAKGGDSAIQVIDWRTVDLDGVKVGGIPGVSAEYVRTRLKSLYYADILLVHHTLAEETISPEMKARALTAAELCQTGAQVLAMGDLHVTMKKSVPRGIGEVLVTYPGSTYLVSASEDPNKYVFIYEFYENGQLAGVEQVLLWRDNVENLYLDDPAAMQKLADIVHKHDEYLAKADEAGAEASPVILVVHYDSTKQDIRPVYSSVEKVPGLIVREHRVDKRQKTAASALPEGVPNPDELQTAEAELPTLASFLAPHYTGNEHLDAIIAAVANREPTAVDVIDAAGTSYLTAPASIAA
jgi:hypothetical protein